MDYTVVIHNLICVSVQKNIDLIFFSFFREILGSQRGPALQMEPEETAQLAVQKRRLLLLPLSAKLLVIGPRPSVRQRPLSCTFEICNRNNILPIFGDLYVSVYLLI